MKKNLIIFAAGYATAFAFPLTRAVIIGFDEGLRDLRIARRARIIEERTQMKPAS